MQYIIMMIIVQVRSTFYLRRMTLTPSHTPSPGTSWWMMRWWRHAMTSRRLMTGCRSAWSQCVAMTHRTIFDWSLFDHLTERFADRWHQYFIFSSPNILLKAVTHEPCGQAVKIKTVPTTHDPTWRPSRQAVQTAVRSGHVSLEPSWRPVQTVYVSRP